MTAPPVLHDNYLRVVADLAARAEALTAERDSARAALVEARNGMQATTEERNKLLARVAETEMALRRVHFHAAHGSDDSGLLFSIERIALQALKETQP